VPKKKSQQAQVSIQLLNEWFSQSEKLEQLRYILMKRVPYQHVEDAVNDIYLKASRACASGKVGPIGNMGGFVWSVTRSYLMNYYRKARSEAEKEVVPLPESLNERSPERIGIYATEDLEKLLGLRLALDRITASLSPADRLYLELRYQGWTLQEIANSYGVPLGTVGRLSGELNRDIVKKLAPQFLSDVLM